MKTQEKNKNKISENAEPVSRRGMSVISRQTPKETSLGKSVFASLLLHLVCTLFFLLLIFCFKFFNINIKLFPEQKPPMHDIEFVMNNEQQPKAIQSKSTQPKAQEKQTSSAPQKVTQPTPPKAITNTSTTKKAAPTKQLPAKNNGAKPKPTGKHSQSTEIPDFSSSMPKLNSLSSGLGSSSKKRSHASGFDASSSSLSDKDSGASSGESSSNHSGFDKATTKKMIAAYDISPYVSELKRNVRWNWKAPKAPKRVELFLRIARDGRIIILNVKKTSEVGDIDNAALSAVKKCSPLNPLPAKYSRNYLDIVLIFDSNSISSRY